LSLSWYALQLSWYPLPLSWYPLPLICTSVKQNSSYYSDRLTSGGIMTVIMTLFCNILSFILERVERIAVRYIFNEVKSCDTDKWRILDSEEVYFIKKCKSHWLSKLQILCGGRGALNYMYFLEMKEV
jgi:hypothetical protein